MSPPLKLGHRMSALPVTQFCPQAGVLGGMGAGRAAAQSTAFHALCAGSPDAQDKTLRLTPDEAAEMTAWKRPADVDIGNGRVLRYADADKELEVALNRFGSYAPADSPEAITVGHLDMAWVVTVGSVRIAYVADIKRSEWTVEEGTRSLQLHAYGLAYAGLHDCDGYAVGIWSAIEGLWQWSDIIDLMSQEALTYVQRIVAAALNLGTDYAMGSHCRACYGRSRCPAWLIPPQLAATELAPLVEGGALTEDNALKLLLTYQRFVDTAKQVESALKDFASRNRGIRDPKSGKVWLPVVSPGRESVSVEAVRQTFGQQADKVIKRGKPYEQFRWVTER